jgi:hypothetical protein
MDLLAAAAYSSFTKLYSSAGFWAPGELSDTGLTIPPSALARADEVIK